MTQRSFWWMLAIVALVCAVFGLRACGSTPPTVKDETRDVASAKSDPASDALAAAEAAKRRALIARRDDAMRDAVSTLHRYLAALGGEDRAAADAFWVDGRVPARSGEADLRQLQGLRRLRSENGTPSALDAEPVPAALQIPVELRAGFADAPVHRYRGWYRLRRGVADGHWQITSASVDAVTAPQ